MPELEKIEVRTKELNIVGTRIGVQFERVEPRERVAKCIQGLTIAQTLQPGSVRQSLEVAVQLAIESLKMISFQRKHNPAGDQFARIQPDICAFLNLLNAIIDVTENVDDNIFGSYQNAPFGLQHPYCERSA